MGADSHYTLLFTHRSNTCHVMPTLNSECFSCQSQDPNDSVILRTLYMGDIGPGAGRDLSRPLPQPYNLGRSDSPAPDPNHLEVLWDLWEKEAGGWQSGQGKEVGGALYP